MLHSCSWAQLWAFLLFSSCLSPSASWDMHIIDNTSSGADGTKLTDVNGDGFPEIVTGWEQGNVARMYFNPGETKEHWDFIEVPAPNVEDALPIDLDQDGWVDMVTCSEGEYMRVSVHWGPTDSKAYTQSDKWHSQDFPVTIGKTRWMFAVPMQVDGKNGVDLILGSKDPHATLGWLEAPAEPRKVANWIYHEISPASWVMSIFTLDIDKDGFLDVLISDRNGPHQGVKWFQNPGTTSEELTEHWPSIPIGMTDADPLFLDVADGDDNGLLEMWVPNLREYFMYFEQGNASGTEWQATKWPIPEIAGLIGKSAAIGDIDRDGLPDLVSTYDHATDKSGVLWSSYDSTRQEWTHHDVSGLEGIKYDFATLIDMDGDGDLDILTSEEANNSKMGPGLGVIWYENPLH